MYKIFGNNQDFLLKYRPGCLHGRMFFCFILFEEIAQSYLKVTHTNLLSKIKFDYNLPYNVKDVEALKN